MFNVGMLAQGESIEQIQVVATTLSGSNRSLFLSENGATYNGWNWLTPTRSGAYADYEYTTSDVSGTPPSGGTLPGVWSAMKSFGVNLTFSLEYPGVIDLSIRKKGTTTPVATGRITYLG